MICKRYWMRTDGSTERALADALSVTLGHCFQAFARDGQDQKGKEMASTSIERAGLRESLQCVCFVVNSIQEKGRFVSDCDWGREMERFR